MIDGNGHNFWNARLINVSSFRSHLFEMYHCKDVQIHDINFKNPAFWTMKLVDMLDLHIYNIDIYVDTMNQQTLMKENGLWDDDVDWPKTPAENDGMDIMGMNVLVENVTVQTYDDAVAVKPIQWGNNEAILPYAYTNCSQNMVIRNVNVSNKNVRIHIDHLCDEDQDGKRLSTSYKTKK